jgi:hypothetical protein
VIPSQQNDVLVVEMLDSVFGLVQTEARNLRNFELNTLSLDHKMALSLL